MDNKFPGKDISEEDIKTKFPLVAKKGPGHYSKFTIKNQHIENKEDFIKAE